jgi:hypothetical protein
LGARGVECRDEAGTGTAEAGVGRAESVGAEFEGFGFGGVGVGAIAAVAGVDDWEAELEREMLSREEELECGREEDLVRREEKVMSMCSGRLKGVCEVIEASAGEEIEGVYLRDRVDQSISDGAGEGGVRSHPAEEVKRRLFGEIIKREVGQHIGRVQGRRRGDGGERAKLQRESE